MNQGRARLRIEFLTSHKTIELSIQKELLSNFQVRDFSSLCNLAFLSYMSAKHPNGKFWPKFVSLPLQEHLVSKDSEVISYLIQF